MSQLYRGAASPEAIEIVAGASRLLPDMRVVTDCVLFVRQPGAGPIFQWSTQIVEKTQSLLRARHVFDVSGVDVQRTGLWRVYARLQISSGFVRTSTGFFTALREFD